MSDDMEPALDVGFPNLDVEFVADESEGRPRRVRVVDNSLRPSKANIAAFWSKVVKSPTCWYWVGATSTPDRYGRSRPGAGEHFDVYAVDAVHGGEAQPTDARIPDQQTVLEIGPGLGRVAPPPGSLESPGDHIRCPIPWRLSWGQAPWLHHSLSRVIRSEGRSAQHR